MCVEFYQPCSDCPRRPGLAEDPAHREWVCQAQTSSTVGGYGDPLGLSVGEGDPDEETATREEP